MLEAPEISVPGNTPHAFATVLRLNLYAPVGEVTYHSGISERLECLPVAVSFLGPPGNIHVH